MTTCALAAVVKFFALSSGTKLLTIELVLQKQLSILLPFTFIFFSFFCLIVLVVLVIVLVGIFPVNVKSDLV